MPLFLLALLVRFGSAYLPAGTSKAFRSGAKIPLYAGPLWSEHTQLSLPYSEIRIKGCEPKYDDSTNLWTILSGFHPQTTCYQIHMNNNTDHQELGIAKADFAYLVENEYRLGFTLDNLPGVEFHPGVENVTDFQYGVRLATPEGHIINHYKFLIGVHDKYIVQFHIVPYFNPDNVLDDGILFTYSVEFITKSSLDMFNRWDEYIKSNPRNESVHFLTIINALVFTLLLAFIIGTIIRKNVRRDVDLYEDSARLDEVNEWGWKQVRGEVFRGPDWPLTYWVLAGSGLQLAMMTFVVLLFAVLGFLTPNHRGSLLEACVLLYFLFTFYSTYLVSRMYKQFGGTNILFFPAGMAVTIPGVTFTIFVVIDIVLGVSGSSEAIGIGSLLKLVSIWVVIACPLAYFGGFFGYKKDPIQLPCRLNKIPRPIVNAEATTSVRRYVFLGGLLPFGTILIELNFIMNSLWTGSYIYWLFGFLFMTSLIFILIASEVSVLMAYILLTKEDGRWWWIAFTASASAGGYMFLYSVCYFMSDLQITGLAGVFVYFGYMFLASALLGLIAGAIGVFASFLFIKQIYSMIKVD